MRPTEPWMIAAGASLMASIASAVRPDDRILVDQWAEANRVLPADTPEPGPFRNTRTPYLIDIQRTMSPGSPYREGWWMKPHQVGGSVTGENLVGAWICTAAGSMLVVFPTLDDAKQWELTRFEPMRASTRALRRRIRPADEKGSDNTKLRKRYPGGSMRLIGSNRISALKSSTVRYVKFEEPDEYQPLEQGSVVDLVMKRASNFGRKAKVYGDGTPTFEGRSEIERQVKRGDQRVWHLHCPDCGHAQPLVWENLRWEAGDPESARYVCRECGFMNGEAAWKTANYAPRPAGCTEEQASALQLAFWRATAQGEPGVASWLGLEALAAPLGWRPWPALVIDWLAAQGDDEKLRSFVNLMRGRPYADKVRSELGAEVLQARAENYPLMSCPMGGLVVNAGVDTQDNRLAVVIRAWGRGEESWGLHHGEIYGSPASPETWAKLTALLETPIRHASGQMMRVDVTAIDAGGHHGEDVYAYCRDAQARGRHVFAVRGAKPYDAPKISRPRKIEFTWRGRPVPGGVELRFLGTQSIKNLIDSRLRLTGQGGGVYHWPLGFEADYFKQMRAERREWKKDKQGHRSLWWMNGSERNEAWDCEVYAYAALLYAMSGRHAETVYREREKLYAAPSPQLDLLVMPAVHADAGPPVIQVPAPVAPPAAAPAPQAAPKPPRGRLRGGFGSGAWR